MTLTSIPVARLVNAAGWLFTVTLVAGVTLYSFEACVENNVTVIDVICSAVTLSLVSTAAAGELFFDFQPLADAAIGIDNSANTRSVTAARESFMGVNDATILKPARGLASKMWDLVLCQLEAKIGSRITRMTQNR